MTLRRLLWPILATAALLVFLLIAVLPTRTYLDQRDAIAAEEVRVRVLDDENAKLAARVAELHTDAAVERLAREQYNLVRPGEDAYAILPAPGTGPAEGAPVPGLAGEGDGEPATPEPSWWHRAVDSLSFWN